MNVRPSLTAALIAALSAGAIMACGTDVVGEPSATDDPPRPDASLPGTDPSDPPNPPDPDGGAADVDVTPPTIVSMTPEDGTSKLKDDVTIVITFSEPMDQAATEAAFAIDPSSKTSGAPEMSWSADGTVLTVLPKAAYVDGPPGVTNVPLRFTVGTGAVDLAGNALAAETSASAWLYRRVTDTAKLDANLFGMTCADSDERKVFVGAGDCATDVESRGYVSFVLPALPAGAELIDAVFEGAVRDLGILPGGAPADDAFATFGDMHLEHVTFTAIDKTAFNAAAHRDLGVVVAAAPGLKVDDPVSKDVTVAVADDYAKPRTLSQYRVRFKTNVPKVDGKAQAALLRHGADRIGITLRYLAD